MLTKKGFELLENIKDAAYRYVEVDDEQNYERYEILVAMPQAVRLCLSYELKQSGGGKMARAMKFHREIK